MPPASPNSGDERFGTLRVITRSVWRLFEDRDPWFFVSFIVWVISTIGFLAAVALGANNTGLSILFAIITTVATFVASQAIGKDAHSAALQGERNLAKERADVHEQYENRLQEESERRLATHSSGSVRQVFRSQTHFISIFNLTDKALKTLAESDASAEVQLSLSTALIELRRIAQTGMECSPDLIEAWREISPIAVDAAIAELDEQQKKGG